MDVITALFHVLADEALIALRAELLSTAPVSVRALKNGLEEIVTGPYPEAVKAVVLPELIALRDVKSLGVQAYGTFKKGDDEPVG